ncbi:MAG: hypothetical protein ACE5DX_02340 [Candidatus Dojkabacteria bacterium]
MEQQTESQAPMPAAPPQKSNIILYVLIAFILGLILGALGFSLLGGTLNTTTDNKTEPTATVEPTEAVPAVDLTQKCTTDSLNVTVNLPAGWTCKGDEVGSANFALEISGNDFDITISNLGRGVGCAPGADSDDCTEEEYYKGDAVDLTVQRTDGVMGEIYGPMKVKDESGGFPFIFITYTGTEDEMPAASKDLLTAILDGIE